MFYIYHSNQLDVLKTLLNSVINYNANDNPLETDLIIVNNLDMARWLKIGIASDLDIAANIKFYIFADFIWDIIYKIKPNISINKFFDKNIVCWMIISRMPIILKDNKFNFISNYLDNCQHEKNLFEFSLNIANIFEKYLIYRPDWLDIWESGKLIKNIGDKQLWQAAIWRDLIFNYGNYSESSKSNLDNFYSVFIQKIHQDKRVLAFLPSRLFIFGISSFPPYHLQVLNTISNYIDIHLFFFNPCRSYWGDIQDQSNKYTSEYFKEEYDSHLSNSLLVSWGKLGSDNLLILNQLEPNNQIEAFIDINEDSLLHNIQNDILHLKNSVPIELIYKKPKCNIKKRCIDIHDKSISINICYSIQREVEALKDYLIRLMNADLELKPSDILVMTTNIDTYIPFIKSTFSHISDNLDLPFTISDNSLSKEHSIIIVFFKLLAIDDNCSTIEDILALLDLKCLANHFLIDCNQLILLQNLIDNTYCYEKLNELKILLKNKENEVIICELKANLLVYIYKNKNNFFPDMLQKKEIENILDNLLLNLSKIIMKLNKWNIILQKSYLLKDWLPICGNIIKDFFNINNESKIILFLLEDYWSKMIKSGINIFFRKLSIKLIKNIFYDRLAQHRISQFFLAGKINFCNLMAMRSFPFKVICLLGMNNDLYPRKSNLHELNLMYKQPRQGDYNLLDEDRYLFLDTIIAAQNKIYISYIGKSIHDNTECHPSNLITELIEYIGQNFYLKGDEDTEINESHKNIKNHLLQYHSIAPFSQENCQLNYNKQSFAIEWLSVVQKTGKVQPSFISILNVHKIPFINIKELLHFWSHPVRAWFNNRLNIYFPIQQLSIKNKYYHCDNLQLLRIKSKLLNALIENDVGFINDMYMFHKKIGNLPPGVFSELFWLSQKQKMQEIAINVVNNIRNNKHCKIQLKFHKSTLTGWLTTIQENGLLRWHPNVLTIREGLLFWIEHLIYCAVGGSGTSKMFGLSKSYWCFDNLSQNKAINLLNNYINGYIHGMSQPIPLLKKSGNAWLMCCYDQRDKKLITDHHTIMKANNRLVAAWNGQYKISRGENTDPYLQRLYNILDDTKINQIIKAAKRWYLPVLIANKKMKY
ncbi:exodeoxyribonuclease V subunit gamma [Candidatus Pantoea edessiphila]|uniref:RecBCD enzyme subunit RecC n=1 Tax=Candidatus Pantoea edessiphila TaxID=2044610 RepID=A0A2P5SZK8_9GAMM|nr:exodeoxyribonuclease V subunit gamma [Candidatus Pantoea edessiphila]PPI87771.1 exodeoxyribonuclease V subunit gamma [Candidatus Pantoea edessiphila]